MVTQKSAFASQQQGSQQQEGASGMMGSYMDSGREIVGGHPLSATMTAFGLGLGVGLVLATMLGESRRVVEHHSFAGKIGKKVMDAINEHVPDSMRNRFGCS
jgi:hypothetical protein